MQKELDEGVELAVLLTLQRRVAELEQDKLDLQRDWDSREKQFQQSHDKVNMH